jgi:hypothetical protein
VADSLENLTAEQRQELAIGKLGKKLLLDPETREAAATLLKKADSTLQFPDIDAKNESRKVKEDAQKRIDELEGRLRERDAREALAKQHARIEEAGLDVKMVNELMEKHGVPSTEDGYNLIMELIQSRAQIAESTPEVIQPMVKPDIKEMWRDPVAWRAKEGYNVLNELLRARRRA